MVRIEAGLRLHARELLAPFATSHIAIVADVNTAQALADELLTRLSCFNPVYIKLPDGLRCERAIAMRLAQEHPTISLWLAVGSGTINDLVKYAAFLQRKPYAVWATAPSMNGYASANASLLLADGSKSSLVAACPVAIWMDLEVMCHAPKRLIQAGVGDSLCFHICERDSLLAHYVLGSPNYGAEYALMRQEAAKLLMRLDKLLQHDMAAMEALCHLLVLGGLAMLRAGSSAPVSQSEHMLAHYAELLAPAQSQQFFHGEQIAAYSALMDGIQRRMLAGPPPLLLAFQPLPSHLNSFREEFVQKSAALQDTDALQERLNAAWPRLVGLSAITTEDWRSLLGLPSSLAALGWDSSWEAEHLRWVRYTRNRFTFLDFL